MAGGGAGFFGDVNVTVNVEGKADDPEATAQAAKRVALDELGAAFEELLLETGSG